MANEQVSALNQGLGHVDATAASARGAERAGLGVQGCRDHGRPSEVLGQAPGNQADDADAPLALNEQRVWDLGGGAGHVRSSPNHLSCLKPQLLARLGQGHLRHLAAIQVGFL